MRGWTAAIGRPWLRVVACSIALSLLVAFCYWQAPGNDFHFDDRDNIIEHRPVHMEQFSMAGLRTAWQQPFLSGRPLASLTFAVDWWRGGGQPQPFQWTNLLLHGITALAVFALLRLAMRSAGHRGAWPDAAAALGAALWLAHPIQVQAVTYIVQRMALMAALFTLLSVICYVCGRRAERRGAGWFALALLAFAAGVSSKESAWITPALWWLAEFGLLRPQGPLLRNALDRVLFALPFVLLLLVVLDFASGQGPLSQRFLPGYAARSFTFAERMLTQPRVLLLHVSQFLWPLPQRFSIEHDMALSRGWMDPPATLAAMAALFAWCLAGLAALWRARLRVVGFFMLWLPLTLAIESSVVPLEMIFEHRMYLPTVGLVGLLVLGLVHIETMRSRRVAVLLVLVAVAGVAWATQQRVLVWRSDLTLYSDALRHAPDSARALSGHGQALLEAGRFAEAEPELARAIALDPEAAEAMEKMAVILLDRGDLAGADRLLRRALELRGGRHGILNHLGEIHMQTGNYALAREMFAQAALKAPKQPVYRWNLALAHERVGACAAAKQEWLAYLQLDPQAEDRAQVEAHLREVHATGRSGCAPVE
jgi:Flp pilus assembly protein TadD